MAQDEALKQPHSRRIGAWKRKAREALPQATLQEQANHAIELAKHDGYVLQLTAEQMEATRPTKGQPKSPVVPNGQPTLAQLTQVAALAKGQGGLAQLVAKVQAVDELARQVGGLDNLRAWLEALLELQDTG